MPNVIPISEPDPIRLLIATGRAVPAQAAGLQELQKKNPASVLSLMRATPADAVSHAPAARHAQDLEIRRFARQRSLSYADAVVEIHRLANQIALDPIYSGGPEAA